MKTLDILRQEFDKKIIAKLTSTRTGTISFKSAQATHRQAGEELISLVRTRWRDFSLGGSLRPQSQKVIISVSHKNPGKALCLVKTYCFAHSPWDSYLQGRKGQHRNTSRKDKRPM